MKKIILLTFCLLCTLITACTTQNKQASALSEWIKDQDKVKVLATTKMIADIAEAVGKDRVAVFTLIHSNLDPHTYELVKGDDEKFLRADLILYNGLGLEHSPSIYHLLTSCRYAYSIGDTIEKQTPEKILWVDGKQDPHIWMDVSMWMLSCDIIADKLSSLDPESTDFYRENATALKKQMQKLHDDVYTDMQSIPPDMRYLVTSHDAFNYFTRAYLATADERENTNWKKRFQAPEGLAPDALLSTTDIHAILQHLSLFNINVLFLESNVSPDSINKIVSSGMKKGLSLTIAHAVLYADAMGEAGSDGDTYFKMIKHNAQVILEHLKP